MLRRARVPLRFELILVFASCFDPPANSGLDTGDESSGATSSTTGQPATTSDGTASASTSLGSATAASTSTGAATNDSTGSEATSGESGATSPGSVSSESHGGDSSATGSTSRGGAESGSGTSATETQGTETQGTQACESGSESGGSSCGETTCGAPSECEVDDPCAEQGVETRVCTDYVCMEGQCVELERLEMSTCYRQTAGDPCQGGRTCEDEFGSCAFEGHATCDETGTQSRTCINRECSAGQCVVEFEEETQSCNRTTAGRPCDAGTSCGPYDTCVFSSDVCDETGTQTRSCVDHTCSAGACVASSPRSEQQSCSRDTDGTSCGTTTCGGYGACVYDEHQFCDENGVRTRSCTDQICRSGGCQPEARNENDYAGCDRDRNGQVCQQGPTCCLADQCTQPCSN